MITKNEQTILSKLPAKQSDLAKALNINRRLVSKIVIAMEHNGLITRKKISSKGITTYLIQKNVKVNVYNPTRISELNQTKSLSYDSKKQKKHSLSYDSKNIDKYKELFNDRKEFSPCTGCEDFCKPVDCEKLISWIM